VADNFQTPDQLHQAAQSEVVLREKEWITNVEEWQTVANTQSNIEARERIVKFLLRSYGGLLAATVLIYLLQGFQLWKFSLASSTLNWLGAATIGEIAGLLTITIRYLFPPQTPDKFKGKKPASSKADTKQS
jgi:hypothetical protein